MLGRRALTEPQRAASTQKQHQRVGELTVTTAQLEQLRQQLKQQLEQQESIRSNDNKRGRKRTLHQARSSNICDISNKSSSKSSSDDASESAGGDALKWRSHRCDER